MQYLINNNRYKFSYEDLKSDYQELVSMTNEKFFRNIPKVLHFICIVCYFKGTPASVLLDDEGLIHRLVHILDESTKDEPLVNNPQVRDEIRQVFKLLCELS